MRERGLTLSCRVARLPTTARDRMMRTKKMKARVRLTPRPTVAPARNPRFVGEASSSLLIAGREERRKWEELVYAI